MGSHLKSIRLQKCEEKGDAFTKVRRRDNGMTVWHDIHRWYLATSGLGVSARMRELMNPKQAKNDETVLGELEQ